MSQPMFTKSSVACVISQLHCVRASGWGIPAIPSRRWSTSASVVLIWGLRWQPKHCAAMKSRESPPSLSPMWTQPIWQRLWMDSMLAPLFSSLLPRLLPRRKLCLTPTLLVVGCWSNSMVMSLPSPSTLLRYRPTQKRSRNSVLILTTCLGFGTGSADVTLSMQPLACL